MTYPEPYSSNGDYDNSSSLDSGYSDSGSLNSGSGSNDYFTRPSFGGSLDSPATEGSSNPNSITGNVADSTPTALVYLKDGTMYTASDYWLADGKLHYVTSYSTESIVDMDEVDLQRTVDENAKRGVTFRLKPTQNGPTAAPSVTPAPNGSGNGTASKGADGRSDGATPAASPAPDPIPAPRVQETSETQTY